MKIKPLEKNNNFKIGLKLFFLISLIGTGFLLDKVFVSKLPDTPKILGETQKIKGNLQDKLIAKVQNSNLVNESVKGAEKISGQILGEASELVADVTSSASSTISTFIYENSIGKIVDQVSKLPQDQQEKIKEQICK
ncbi:MAG: hypothetical protein UR89_C0016G0010 [Candidatus Roizmanbacteria bacterium GW2011_GWA2_35_8]|uniref:Uncharacterized protein n=1 Tax=Candidatus Roizmanbacteria bacterium GW2011_GWA2_35_8 TaxID=1618479 RepID=A0A0G0DDG6_9BACT|nr:MAG: hypothetical protein UR89_C0016G0010 [Candidatus Roizmanbacteria bacterium GW2011_GWA2_35_8]